LCFSGHLAFFPPKHSLFHFYSSFSLLQGQGKDDDKISNKIGKIAGICEKMKNKKIINVFESADK
jgi:hypothetical protein